MYTIRTIIKHKEIERIVILSKVLSKKEISLYIKDTELIRDSINSKFDLVIRIMLNERLHHASVY